VVDEKPDGVFVLQIDTSDVPDELRQKLADSNLEQTFREEILDPLRRRWTCVHEAAHLVYLRRICGCVPAVLTQPKIKVREKNWVLEKASIAVSPMLFISMKPLIRARYRVIGGIAEAVLAKSPEADKGMTGDFNQFLEEFQYPSKMMDDIKALWDTVKEAVAEELEKDEALRTEILEMADKFEKVIYKNVDVQV
jgi:hypothetical protein